MRSFLLQPYPFGESFRKKLAVCGSIGLFVTLFLAIFEPFGFDQLSTAVKWQHAACFGSVTFLLSAFFQILLPRFLPALFREEHWKSWKEIAYLLVNTVFIGAGNYALMLYLYPQDVRLSNFFKAELITVQIGIFPIVFIVFMKQLNLYRRFAGEAKEVSDDLVSEHVPTAPTTTAPNLVSLQGENQNESITLAQGDLFGISSSDNYVKLLYREQGQQRSLLLRGSLKRMEEQLAGHPSFFRCHRMHLVNLSLVSSVTGNAQGLRLHLSGCAEDFPVSRSLTDTVKSRLHHLSHSPRKS